MGFFVYKFQYSVVSKAAQQIYATNQCESLKVFNFLITRIEFEFMMSIS